jgi:hypothetical protein
VIGISWSITAIKGEYTFNIDVNDNAKDMLNLTQVTNHLITQSELATCKNELDFEQHKLCGGEKELDNMRKSIGEGYLNGCVNGCEYYTRFNLNKIANDSFESCKIFCKHISETYYS